MDDDSLRLSPLKKSRTVYTTLSGGSHGRDRLSSVPAELILLVHMLQPHTCVIAHVVFKL